MATSRKGIFPVSKMPMITIRATQSVMMSRLVTSVFVG